MYTHLLLLSTEQPALSMTSSVTDKMPWHCGRTMADPVVAATQVDNHALYLHHSCIRCS